MLLLFTKEHSLFPHLLKEIPQKFILPPLRLLAKFAKLKDIIARRGMRTNVFGSGLGWVLLAAGALLPQIGRAVPPPASAYAELPSAAHARMSPDGSRIAYWDQQDGSTVLKIAPIDGDQTVSIPIYGWHPTFLEWKDDQTLLASAEQTVPAKGAGPDWSIVVKQFMAFKADGSKVATFKADSLLNDLPGQPNWVLEERGFRDIYADRFGDRNTHYSPAVYRSNVWSSDEAVVNPAQPDVAGWEADQNGVVRAGIGTDESNVLDHIIVRRTVTDAWHGLPIRATYVGFSADDSDALYALTRLENGDTSLVRINIGTGTIAKTFVTAPSGRIAAIYDSGLTVGYALHGDDGEDINYIDPARAEDKASIAAALKISNVELVDHSADGKRVTALVMKPGSPVALWLLDRSQTPAALNPLLVDYDSISADQIGQQHWTSFRARDGVSIPVRVILPPNVPNTPISFVVLPHDGPSSRDGNGFDWVAQFLASRGYGVLQPEYRGSSGYGQEFMDRGNGQWGLATQDDITDATNWAIEQKLADPRKICIVGAGFGGYAALEGAVKEPRLYTCAAAFGAITDIPQFLYDVKFTLTSNFDVSEVSHDNDVIRAVSPALHADKIQIPVLLVAGTADYTVTTRQTQRMQTALRKAGKTEQTIYLPDADHYLSRPADRLAWLNALDGFLGKYLGGE